MQNNEISLQKEEIELQAEHLSLANEQLKSMDEFKEAMTGMIVHDLKNPLNTIIGVAQQTSAGPFAKMIEQAGKQMLNMVLNIF